MTAPAPPELEVVSADDRARWRLPPPVRGIRAAFIFLTRIPLGGFPYRRQDWIWATAHAPFVGLVVGGVTGAVCRTLSPIGAPAAAILAIGVSLLLTGAFHEDGLADTSDALGGAYDRARLMAILKDSRIGTFGGAALVISVGGRAALLAELGAAAAWGMPLVGCLARTAPIWLMAALPYVTATPEAKSRDFARGGWLQALVATGWAVLAMTTAVTLQWITSPQAGVMMLMMLLVAVVTGWRYRKRAGGITGDFLGATEQIGELGLLAVLAWKW